MDGNTGVAAALAAMRPDDGRRYEGCLMLSALPQAPTVSRHVRGERLLRLVRRSPRADSAGGSTVH